MEKLHFAGTDLLIEPADLSPNALDAIMTCCPPGTDAEPYVLRFMEGFTVTGDEKDCANYLRGYGAWNDEELKDHKTNLERLVWLTAGSFADGEAAYFSTY